MTEQVTSSNYRAKFWPAKHPEELALANGLSHQRAKEQAALAAAEVRAQTGSLAERQAALKRTIAIREDLISQTLQIQEEYEREKRRKDEMVLEKIDLELEMESETRTWERNMDRKRMEQPVVTQLPGVVSSVDLICLRSELTVQKELTEQEVAQSSLANGTLVRFQSRLNISEHILYTGTHFLGANSICINLPHSYDSIW